MNPCVISSVQLAVILSHHPCFRDRNDIRDVSLLITTHAMKQRLLDLYLVLKPCFRGWMEATYSHPSHRKEANGTPLFVSPVHEYLRYRGRYFLRNRHCVGITFATFIPIDNREVGVVWTTTRRAYLFEYIHLQGWVVFKVLNRQDDPFLTWLRHLGGDTFVDDRSPERLFHDLVFPYFGSHPLARKRVRGIRRDDQVWDLVKRVSYDVVSHTDVRRFEWISF